MNNGSEYGYDAVEVAYEGVYPLVDVYEESTDYDEPLIPASSTSRPSSDTGEGLLVLNDDCLLHICRFVSVTDLGCIRDTCKRLRPLAHQSFRLRKNKSLAINCHSTFADIRSLRHFGKFINSLSVVSVDERYASLARILEMVAKCTGSALKSISFYDCCDEEKNTFECLKSVLKNVECIELQWFESEDVLNAVLSYCENLKEICVGGELVYLNSDWCAKNRNVTKLTLTGLEDDSILEEICKTLTLLRCLTVHFTETHTTKIFHLRRLRHLKELKVESRMIGPALENFTDKTVLEDLTLVCIRLTESLVNVLREFPNLSNLIFDNCEIFDDNVQQILSAKLGNVKNLSFEWER